MKSETRFIIYTNDAMLLALAEFPLSIMSWNTLSSSQKNIFVIEEEEGYTVKSKLVHIFESKKSKTVLPVRKKLFAMPPGSPPKIGKLSCVGDGGRVFDFKRYTLHPNFILDPSHLEVISAIEKTWNGGLSHIGALVKEIPKAASFIPKRKNKSILQLEKVDDNVNKAKNIEILWDIRDQIVLGGNIYAKTPICDVVERTQVTLRQWEYRPYRPRNRGG